MVTLLRQCREERDSIIEAANTRFDRLLGEAYEGGMSLTDLHLATDLSMNTVRARLRSAGVSTRPAGTRSDLGR